MSALRAERVVTSGTFSLDGETFGVDTNVWLVGDDDEVLIVDAAHDARAVVAAVAGRRVTAVVCTHGHDDHIGAAPALARATGAPVLLHPADRELWDTVHPGRAPDELRDGQRLLPLPGATVVHTGHGRDTTIAAERPHVPAGL